jgi:hypothetical protein
LLRCFLRVYGFCIKVVVDILVFVRLPL